MSADIVERLQAAMMAYASARTDEAMEDEPMFFESKRAKVREALLAWHEAVRTALAERADVPEPMTREFCAAYPGTAAGIINALARQIDAAPQPPAERAAVPAQVVEALQSLLAAMPHGLPGSVYAEAKAKGRAALAALTAQPAAAPAGEALK